MPSDSDALRLASTPRRGASTVRAQGGVLAVNSYKKVESTQEGYAITRTNDAGAVPCTRTCWTVCPADGMPAPADGLLRVGMRFYLKTETEDGPLYLQSLRYGLSNLNYSTGISNAQRKNGTSAVKAFSADTAWCARCRPVGAPVTHTEMEPRTA